MSQEAGISDDRERDTILILGASSDIGLEIISELAPERPRILAHYNQSAEKLERLAQSVVGATIVPLQADLSDVGQTEALIETIRGIQPLPNKLVHLPAPALDYIRFKDVRWDDFQRYFDVQLRSLVMVLQAIMPDMAKQKRGKVVAVLSSCTLCVPPAAMSHYVTAKYALLGLIRALAAEYSGRQININAVSPSMVETAFLQKMDERMVEITAAQSPFQRHASRADVAAAVRFLLSQQSDYITGANLPISGGAVF